MNSGEPIILQIFAQDNESDSIDYTWTIEQGTENEAQFSGPQVIYEFSEPGPKNVVCKIENDAGLASYAEILVIVEAPETEGGRSLFAVAIFSIVLFSALALVGVYAFNIFVVRRMDELSEPEDDEEEEIPSQTPAQSQIQMWGGGSSASPLQAPVGMTSPSDQEPDLMDLLGTEGAVQETPSTTNTSSLLSDLEPSQSNNDLGVQDETKVRKECQRCSRPFEISLPKGVEAAYTNCPYCGSEELVSLRDVP